jgi:hypothetical protein
LAGRKVFKAFMNEAAMNEYKKRAGAFAPALFNTLSA